MTDASRPDASPDQPSFDPTEVDPRHLTDEEVLQGLKELTRRSRLASSADMAALGRARAHIRDALAFVETRMSEAGYSPGFGDDSAELAAMMHEAFALIRLLVVLEAENLSTEDWKRLDENAVGLTNDLKNVVRERARREAECIREGWGSLYSGGAL